MKKTLLEVMVVLLAMLLRKYSLETQTDLNWEVLIIPAGIIAIAASLRLINFNY